MSCCLQSPPSHPSSSPSLVISPLPFSLYLGQFAPCCLFSSLSFSLPTVINVRVSSALSLSLFSFQLSKHKDPDCLFRRGERRKEGRGGGTGGKKNRNRVGTGRGRRGGEKEALNFKSFPSLPPQDRRECGTYTTTYLQEWSSNGGTGTRNFGHVSSHITSSTFFLLLFFSRSNASNTPASPLCFYWSMSLTQRGCIPGHPFTHPHTCRRKKEKKVFLSLTL